MTKRHFIALADAICEHNAALELRGERAAGKAFDHIQICTLADFCQSQNPQFMRERWLGYIAGTNGKNGGTVKVTCNCGVTESGSGPHRSWCAARKRVAA